MSTQAPQEQDIFAIDAGVISGFEHQQDHSIPSAFLGNIIESAKNTFDLARHNIGMVAVATTAAAAGGMIETGIASGRPEANVTHPTAHEASTKCNPHKPVTFRMIGPRKIEPNIPITYTLVAKTCKPVRGATIEAASLEVHKKWHANLTPKHTFKRKFKLNFPEPVSNAPKSELGFNIVEDAIKNYKYIGYKTFTTTYK